MTPPRNGLAGTFPVAPSDAGLLNANRTARAKPHLLATLNRLIAAVLVLVLAPAANANSVAVELGDTQLNIPAPTGFTNGAAVSAEALAYAEGLTPSMNQLLALFLSSDDAARLATGEPATWHRYMLVQTETGTASARLSSDEFFEARTLLTAQQRLLQANANKPVDAVLANLSRDLHSELEAGENLPLGIFSEDQAHISMAALARHRNLNPGAAPTYLVASATNVIHVANKIVFTYVFSTYTQPSDLDWVQNTASTWTRAVLAVNSRSTVDGLVDWLRTSTVTVSGVVLVTLTAIAYLLARRRRRRAEA